ncbi:unnamed protein product, partial [Didymodactylos carnosus]
INFSRITMSILQFPAELFLEIFRYLSGNDIIHSFFDVDFKIDSIISLDSHLMFDLRKLSKDKFDYCCQQLLPEYSERCYSLKISNDLTWNAITLFSSIFDIELLSNLRSLTLIYLTFQECKAFLSKQLPRLTYLSIKLNITQTDRKDISQIISADILPVLKTCVLEYRGQLTFQPLTANKSAYLLSPIQYLSIDGCSYDDLFIIFQYFPKIKSLKAKILDYKKQSTDIYENLCTLVPYLNELKLQIEHVPFDSIELLLKNLSQLKSFTLDVNHNQEYLDSQRWKHVFEQSLPDLKHFHFHLTLHRRKQRTFNGVLESFQTKFWYDKCWYITYYYNENLEQLHIYTVPYQFKEFNLGTNLIQPIILFSSFELISNMANLDMNRNQQEQNQLSYVDMTAYCEVERLIIQNYSSTLTTSIARHLPIFPNVHSLELNYAPSTISDLTHLTPLNKLKHLEMLIPLSSHIFLDLLKSCSMLSSLTADFNNLLNTTFHVDDDNEYLISYVQNMIKQCWLCGSYVTIDANNRTKFLSIFKYVEYFRLTIETFDHLKTILPLLMDNMQKLISLQIDLIEIIPELSVIEWLDQNKKLLGTSYRYNYQTYSFRIWK